MHIVDICAGLTLTWDVFKFNKNICTTTFSTRLTLTWDVFKFFAAALCTCIIKGLTLTWDVFKFKYY